MELFLITLLFGSVLIGFTTDSKGTQWGMSILFAILLFVMVAFVKYKPQEEFIHTFVTTEFDRISFSCPVKIRRIQTTYPWSLKPAEYRFEVDCGSIHTK